VDDGSTDNSPEILDTYASADARICVIHKVNGGTSSARNAGLDRASGAYIAFLDPDDWIHKDYFQILVELAQQHKADITRCGFHVCADEAYSHSEDKIESVNVTENRVLDDQFTPQYLYHSVWALLLRADAVGSIRFPLNVPMGQDAVFCTKIMSQAKRMRFVMTDAKLYFYYQRPGSAIRRANAERYDILARSYWKNVSCAERKDYFLYKAFHALLLSRYVSSFDKKNEHIYKRTQKLLFECSRLVIAEKNIPLKKKLSMLCRAPSLRVYRAIMMWIEPGFKEFEEGLTSKVN
jgi:glycosyltransferase involved in cell wall biosynthesis